MCGRGIVCGKRDWRGKGCGGDVCVWRRERMKCVSRVREKRECEWKGGGESREYWSMVYCGASSPPVPLYHISKILECET